MQLLQMAYRRYFNVLKDDRHKTEKAGQQPGIDVT
jgi:hypothetical protein